MAVIGAPAIVDLTARSGATAAAVPLVPISGLAPLILPTGLSVQTVSAGTSGVGGGGGGSAGTFGYAG